jgi:hypothetical protein
MEPIRETELPKETRDLCRAFLHGLQTVLGPKLHAVYLYGAVAFPEGGATGDIDFHVILRDKLDHRQVAALRALHQRMGRDHPPLGRELDGYYILLEDARLSTPPRHQWLDGAVDAAWALHRAHILAGRYITLYGPDPRTIYRAPDWPELAETLHDELDYVKSHIEEYPAYCVLNLCRLMYSFHTRDVVISKRAAARWARQVHPEWQSLVGAAERTYDRAATQADAELLKRKIGSLYAFAVARIPRRDRKTDDRK